MVSVEFRESITEILEILNHMEKRYTDKIPKKFMSFLEENKSTAYEPNFDHSRKLSELNLKEKTKDFLAIMYIKYWCSLEEKAKYEDSLIENERRYQEKIKRLYNVTNNF